MKRVVLGLAVCTVACHDSSTAQPDAAPIDAQPIDAVPIDATHFASTVHGTLTLVAAVNDATGAPTPSFSSPDPATTHLSVTRADGTTDPITLSGNGAFDVGLHAVGQKYRVRLAIDGQVPREFASDSTTLKLAVTSAGRLDRAPVVNEVVIKGVFGNWVDGDTAILDSTGLWTATGQQFVTSPPPNQTEPWAFSWTWSTAGSLSGPVGLLDASRHDALQLTEWHETGSGAAAYQSITAALVHSDITMMNGSNIELGNDNAPISIPALTPRCLHVVAPRASELARVVAAVPDTYFEGVDNWELQAPAGTGVGVTGALAVAISGETGSGSAVTATNADLTVSFGSPFGGTQVIASTSAHEVREIHAAAGDNAIFLQAGTQSWVEATMPADCSGTAPVINPAPVVAIPSFPSLGGTALDHDQAIQISTLPGTDEVVTWTQAGSGVADEYVAQLVEISENAGAQQTVQTTLDSVFTSEPTAAFDSGLFQLDHTYLIEVFARQGFPGAGSGDFQTITFPFANAVTISHLFTVVVGN